MLKIQVKTVNSCKKAVIKRMKNVQHFCTSGNLAHEPCLKA